MARTPSPAVLAALQKAAQQVPEIDFEFLYREAYMESGFDPNIKASTSSATGLFQFLDATWQTNVNKYGKQYGVSVGQRTDPYASAIIGALFSRDNKRYVESKIGRKITDVELYLAHFLGAGGATDFLGAMDKNKNAPANKTNQDAANANKPVFFNANGTARSYAEVLDYFSKRFYALSMPSDKLDSTVTAPLNTVDHVQTVNHDEAPKTPTVNTPAGVATAKDVAPPPLVISVDGTMSGSAKV